ncbi:hypothetical protein GCM10009827_017460 [Dactylosporangium maewongense]|uniref:Uncharacterized protein n=1 Tax=Dactylosporangium maewongense TaxID=634393 RepID=A0ABN1ZUD9_9ACTN
MGQAGQAPVAVGSGRGGFWDHREGSRRLDQGLEQVHAVNLAGGEVRSGQAARQVAQRREAELAPGL